MSDPIARLNKALEGRYRLERQIGEGGMATVYLAEDLKHRRKVALKVLKPELAAMVGGERFLTEIETTAKLKHPHILPLHDSGEADGFLFFVMPYLEGESLRDRIDRDKQLPVDEAVQIARKVAGALQHAHEHGVVHRDVKPGNILFQDNEPVVTDFGIALAAGVAGGTRLTETGLSVGTPFYMSPEQATGDQDMGPRSDIYSLGCVLYEMLVGDPPYPGSTAQAVLGKIIQGLPVSATAARRSVPANVDAAIRKALEKLPADRFTSAQDFGRALNDSGFRYGSEAAAGAARSAGPWKGLAVAGYALALLFALGFGLLLFRTDPSQPVSRQYLDQAAWAGDEAPLGRHSAVAPDGSSMILPVVSEGGVQLALKLRGSTEITAIPGTEGAVDVVYSPDGQWIAYAMGSDLFKRPLVGGSPLRLADDTQGGQNSVAGLDWLDDGTILYEQLPGDGTRPRRVVRISEDGGEPIEVAFWPEDQAVAPVWVKGLPGAAGALVVACAGTTCPGESAQLYVVDLEDLSWDLILDRVLRAWYAPTGHLVYVQADGAVFAQPFDLDALQTTGSAIPLFANVRVTRGSQSDYADMTLGDDGTLLYAEGESALGSQVPFWVTREGSVEAVAATLVGAFSYPAVSPDGRRIAFEHIPVDSQREDIWVFDSDQETLSRLTFDGDRNIMPFWSPDGSEVGYNSFRGDSINLYSRSADLSGEARLLIADAEAGVYEAGWTPDARYVVYRKGWWAREGFSDLLYAAPHPDSAAHVLLDSSANEANPSVSPDGRWLAYMSDESGQWEVYVRPFPGPGGQSQVSTAGGINPIWAHNGQEIFYLAGGSPLVLTVATVRTSPDFAVERREEILSWGLNLWVTAGPHWDLSPDDERVVGIGNGPPPQGEGRYVLVQNFFEELRQVVPD